MNILATLVLLYFFANQVRMSVDAYREGHHPVWVWIGLLMAATLSIPLVAIWL